MIVSNYRRNGQPLVETVPRPRAESVEIFARQNFSTRINWTARKEFSDLGAVAIFMNSHPEALMGKGTLTVTVNGSTRRLLNAVLVVGDMRPNGRELYIDYEALGGVMT